MSYRKHLNFAYKWNITHSLWISHSTRFDSTYSEAKQSKAKQNVEIKFKLLKCLAWNVIFFSPSTSLWCLWILWNDILQQINGAFWLEQQGEEERKIAFKIKSKHSKAQKRLFCNKKLILSRNKMKMNKSWLLLTTPIQMRQILLMSKWGTK